jgi:ethanolamine-phosphate cytidylyltransferase
VHGDDPCIVDGKDVYETAKRAGKFRTIPRTEGVSTTDIVGRMFILTKDHHMKKEFGVLGSQSKFLTTTRLLQLFSTGIKSPTSDMRVIYIDSSWDMFHPGHVAILKSAKEVGATKEIVSSTRFYFLGRFLTSSRHLCVFLAW